MEKKRPKDLTPKGFGELVEAALQEKDKGGLPIHELSALVRVAPATIMLVLNGEFPGEPTGEKISNKFLRGRVESVVRICKTLDLDINSCLVASGLPQNKRWIESAMTTLPKLLVIDASLVEELAKVLHVTGPLPLNTVLEMLESMLDNRNSQDSPAAPDD